MTTRRQRKNERASAQRTARERGIWNAAIRAAQVAIGRLDGSAEDVAESAEAHSHQGAYLSAVVDGIEVVGLLRRGRR